MALCDVTFHADVSAWLRSYENGSPGPQHILHASELPISLLLVSKTLQLNWTLIPVLYTCRKRDMCRHSFPTAVDARCIEFHCLGSQAVQQQMPC